MEASLYYIHLQEFVRVHNLPTDLRSRVVKLLEEVKELEEAQTPEELIKEAADVFNVAAHIILLLGGIPTYEGYKKLVEAAARPEYRRLRGLELP